MPNTIKHYVHRVGRTARAGKAGRSVSLVGEEERKMLKEIVKTAKAPVKARILPQGVWCFYWGKKLGRVCRDIVVQRDTKGGAEKQDGLHVSCLWYSYGILFRCHTEISGEDWESRERYLCSSLLGAWGTWAAAVRGPGKQFFLVSSVM